METTLKQEIIKEKMQIKPDWLYINTLEKMKGGEYNAETFASTGRFMPKHIFLSQRPNAPLHKDCTDIVRYVGGFYIQALKSGRFIFELNDSEQSDEVGTSFEDKTLSVVEQKMWDIHAKKHFKK